MSERYDRTHARQVVLHHLGDGLGAAKTAEELIVRANPNHYQFPEYDFGIIASGQIVPLRPLTYIGAHAQANKGAYMYGYNSWNKSSISIVMANDNTKWAPPAEMVEGTIACLLKLSKDPDHLITIKDIYLHSQIFTTDCPGAKYSALGLNSGYLDFDQMMTELNARMPKVPPHECKRVTAKTVHLREMANPQATKITVLHQGDKVQVLAKQMTGWYKVAVGEHTGYIYSEYLD